MQIDISQLVAAYYDLKPTHPVEFGTSGHRGSSLTGSFNERHIAAISQAICEYRATQGTTGPLFIGFDTHALSFPAFKTALEVLAANGVEVVCHKDDEFTPTPVISRLIINHNHGRSNGLADGIVITPSHNGPQDGGFKYNPTHGGPADTDVTGWVQDRANQLINNNNEGVNATPFETARGAGTVKETDFITPFVADLARVVDFEAIHAAKIKIGADPMGGSGVHYWAPIAEKYGLDLTVVNDVVDPTFGFMTVDSDKTIRMDCSSKDAMASLISLKDQYQIAFGNDTDFDRHGIVTPDGLMNPNHYLSVAIWYLLQYRPQWSRNLKIGKTIVSSSMIDRVVKGFLNHELYEVPVGFKWFVKGLSEGWLAFGGEESAGASFLTLDGKTWTTDKDGFALALLSAEIVARIGKTPSQIYREILVPRYGDPFYKRADITLNTENVTAFRKNVKTLANRLSVGAEIAGRRIVQILTTAPGNGAAIGGTKVILDDGSWFAARASGTELKGKLYIESYQGEEHWQTIHDQVYPMLMGV